MVSFYLMTKFFTFINFCLNLHPKFDGIFYTFFQFDILKDSLKNLYSTTGSNIINPIDLYDVKERANSYASFDALMKDIGWISHNISIMGSSAFIAPKGRDDLKLCSKSSAYFYTKFVLISIRINFSLSKIRQSLDRVGQIHRT